MKTFSAALTLSLFAFVLVSAQSPCLPEGITFTTQQQIDNFPLHYNGCTEIEGDVTIGGDWSNPSDIINLEGLSALTSIWGNLNIEENHFLTNLDGLNNLTTVGGFLFILRNESLTDLTGLENLTSIGGSLWISDDSITSISGLENLISVGGDLRLYDNDALVNLAGFESLETIGEDLMIGHEQPGGGNDALVNLAGLENLNSIGGSLIIINNQNLVNLEGLSNLTFVPGNLEIGAPSEIGTGAVGNPSMANLSGLDNVTSVGESLYILDNEILSNLSGLENLTTIGGEFHVGLYDWWVGHYYGNPSLEDLSALQSLVNIGGELSIECNENLTNLEGLNNIEPASIEGIKIHKNVLLVDCEVQSICDYLVAPSGNVIIEENAPGCNSVEEVIEACETVGIQKQIMRLLTIQPNPTSIGNITITLDNPNILYLSCFNTFGQQVHRQEIPGTKTEIDVSAWAPGIYLAVVSEDGRPVGRSMFVVQ